MVSQNNIIADFHVHTIASKHAYSTLKENIDVCKSRNIKYVAITDHYFHDGIENECKNETSRISYIDRVNRVEKDCTVIAGAEFNLGQKIYSWDKLSKLTWRPIGLHNSFFDTSNSSLNFIYNLFEEATFNKKHNAFVHIERELHKVNHRKHGVLSDDTKLFLEKVVKMAKEKDILLEINETSIITNDGGCFDRLKYWLEIAKDNRCEIYLGTDAHYCMEAGLFDNAIKLLNEIGYPEELILNIDEEKIKYNYIRC